MDWWSSWREAAFLCVASFSAGWDWVGVGTKSALRRGKQGELEARRAEPKWASSWEGTVSSYPPGTGLGIRLRAWGKLPRRQKFWCIFQFFGWALLQSCYANLCAVLKVDKVPGRLNPSASPCPSSFLPSSTAGSRLLIGWATLSAPSAPFPSQFPSSPLISAPSP